MQTGTKHTALSLFTAFLILLLLNGCAATPQSDRLLAAIPESLTQAKELQEVPFYAQEKYQCGPAALATLLQTKNVNVTPGQLVKQIYIPERKGSLQIEIISSMRRYGLIPYLLRPRLEEVLQEVRAGRPVLVLQDLGFFIFPQWHYAVLVGYDLHQRNLILRSGEEQRHIMDIHDFERSWQRARHWALLALQPGEMPLDPDEWHYTTAIVGFEHLKRWQILEKSYQAGLAIWPDSKELNLGFGNLHYLQQHPQQARKHYQHLVNVHPDYAPAHNNLAQVLAEQGELSSALLHAKRAVELGGQHTDEYQATLLDIQRQLQQP